MSVSDVDAGTVAIEAFDPASKTHPALLYRFCRAYLVEEFNRTRVHPAGLIADPALVPVFISSGGKPVGVVSIDPIRRSAETIYIEPRQRGRGVATQAMLQLRERHRIGTVKGPLSPASAGIPGRVGAVVDYGSDAARMAREAVAEGAREAVLGVCSGLRHRASRLYGKPCDSCYRRELGRASDLAVGAYLEAVRQGRAAVLTEASPVRDEGGEPGCR